MSTTSNVVVETTVNAFQRRLDSKREELGLSINLLAKRAGLPYSTVRRILMGDLVQPPKQEQLECLAKAVGWEPEWLYIDAIQAWNPGLMLHAEESEDLQHLMAVVKNLSPARRRALIRAAEALRNDNGE